MAVFIGQNLNIIAAFNLNTDGAVNLNRIDSGFHGGIDSGIGWVTLALVQAVVELSESF
jgi:hypothetical protein